MSADFEASPVWWTECRTQLALPSCLHPPAPSPLPAPLADLLACEAQFVVTIGSVPGVLDTSILDLEPGPQGPFITYSYYVTYDFVEDKEGEASEYGGVLAEVCTPPAPAGRVGLCSQVHRVSYMGRTASGPGKHLPWSFLIHTLL